MPVNLGPTLTSFISRAIRILRGENRQAVDQEPSPISPADPQEQTPIDAGILLRCLEIEWQDHFQTRQQTWRTRHVGDFTNWKDHHAYQKAFERLLRDLKASEARA